MSATIAVLDDEEDILDLLVVHLRGAGFRVEPFTDSERFLKYLKGHIPDLVLLDLMLPGMDGVEICRLMKRSDVWGAIPIIMLTAKAEETDRIVGLEIGADDYVTKPFSPKELVARVKAVLRRRDIGSMPIHETANIQIGDFIDMDLKKYLVKVEGNVVNLTTTEFKLLRFLASREGWVFSRESILEHLWGNEKYVIDRTVDVHIRHLREKLGDHGRIIKNVRGVGYKLET